MRALAGQPAFRPLTGCENKQFRAAIKALADAGSGPRTREKAQNPGIPSPAFRRATFRIRQLPPPASGATSGGRWRSEVSAEPT
jgi:hypothetical protein